MRGSPLLWCERQAERLASALARLGAVLVALMAVHVAADVAARYVANFPLPGTVETVSHYYMVAVIFLPIGYVQMRNGHFAAEVFTQRLPKGALRMLDTVIAFVTAALLLVLAWHTGAYAMAHTETREFVQTAYFPIPTWPPRWAMPVGLGLTAAIALLQGLRGLTAPAR